MKQVGREDMSMIVSGCPDYVDGHMCDIQRYVVFGREGALKMLCWSSMENTRSFMGLKGV